ncbi:MAG: hypothetical protein ACFFCS_27980, partial [Candidatus Hodarchaeota archaeon]
YRLGYFALITGGSVFLFESERIMKRTRYIITILNIIGLFLTTVLPFDLAIALFDYMLYAHICLFIVIIYLFTKWSRLEFKAVASIQVLAVGFFMMGSIFRIEQVRDLELLPSIIPHAFIILGAFISMSSGIINPKRYAHALRYWIILGGLTLALIVTMAIVLFLSPFIIGGIGSVVALFAGVYMFFKTIKIIKIQTTLIAQPMQTTSTHVDVLEGFIKRRDITEKEITYYKEQKICLVCKGNATGLNLAFICPECDVLYCEKCVRVLIGMENACWACNSPLDPSKPVKTEQGETEELRTGQDVIVEPQEDVKRDHDSFKKT